MQATTWQTLNTPDSTSFRGVYIYFLAGMLMLIAAFLFTFAGAGKSASNERIGSLHPISEQVSFAEPSG